MEDDDKLKEERDFALKTREKTSKGAAGKYFCLCLAIHFMKNLQIIVFSVVDLLQSNLCI